jgi:glycosyltransferase involved in cell wall biosynthesis
MQADIFVLPTFEDEWGVVVNEAMTAARPVLGSVYSQAVEELVVDGMTGWRFRPDCPSELDAVLTRVLDTPSEELLRIGAAARERALQLAPAIVADRIADIIRRVRRETAMEPPLHEGA